MEKEWDKHSLAVLQPHKDSITPNNRQTGRTTRAMLDAPRGAVYVWCNAYLSYPRNLARRLGRGDLVVVGPSAIKRERLYASRAFYLLDHATAAALRTDDRDFWRQWAAAAQSRTNFLPQPQDQK